MMRYKSTDINAVKIHYKNSETANRLKNTCYPAIPGAHSTCRLVLAWRAPFSLPVRTPLQEVPMTA